MFQNQVMERRVSLRSSELKAGKLTGVVYLFEKANDILERHFHEAGAGHITVVSSGSVRIIGDGWEKELKIGNVMDLPDHESHEIIALEDNTKIVNINKG
jgi:quercetin dioxygenase-like cupin family protein